MISRQMIPWKIPWTVTVIESGLLRIFVLTTGVEFLLRVAPERAAAPEVGDEAG